MINKAINSEGRSTVHSRNRKGHKIFGILLSMVGLFLFLQSSGWISPEVEWSNFILPLGFIVTGLFILFSTEKPNKGNNGDADTVYINDRSPASCEHNVSTRSRRT
jgi:hypothetical protein